MNKKFNQFTLRTEQLITINPLIRYNELITI